MPRKPAVTPNKHLHTTIPADLAARLDLLLWSELENRVPQGAYQDFICNAIRDFFNKRTVDISPYLPDTPPGQHFITATSDTLRLVLNQLRGNQA